MESKSQYEEYRALRQGEEEANLIKMYSQLTQGHKKAVQILYKRTSKLSGKVKFFYV